MERFMRPLMILYGITTLLAGCLGSESIRHQSGSDSFRSFKGRVPPEIVSSERHWVNASRAVTLERLRGKVVWLQFNF